MGYTIFSCHSETAYYISSLDIIPKLAFKAVRKHWAVENCLHYVLDVTFKEDNSRIRTKYATENMAVLRRLALNLVKLSEIKGSVKSILKRCAWNDEVRDLIIKG
ncbi:MAG: ISAs1 family transposase [Moraxellaceae bacterium]|nr:ISAs1 family transposase [Moraxellaceae bacterium]